MKTSLLLAQPFTNPAPADSDQPVSITALAFAKLRRLLGDSPANFERVTELRVDAHQLARARRGSMQVGDSEVVSEAKLTLVIDNDRAMDVGLWLACKSAGPIRVTTYYEGILL